MLNGFKVNTTFAISIQVGWAITFATRMRIVANCLVVFALQSPTEAHKNS